MSLPPWIFPASSCNFCFVLFPTPVPHPGTRLSAKRRRSHWDARLSSVSVVFMPVPRKICHPALLYSFFFCRLTAGGCDGFLSCFNGFFVWSWRRIQTIWSAWVWTTKHTHTHTRLSASLRQVLTQLDLERKRSTAALSKQKWKSLVAVRSRTKAEHSCFIQTEMKQSSSNLAVSTHTLWPVHLRKRGGGVGGSHLARDKHGVSCDWAFFCCCCCCCFLLLFFLLL